MSHSSSLRQSALQAAESFLSSVLTEAPRRLEATVLSREGMPLLCAVEAALARTPARLAAQELVWLGGAPAPGAHLLNLRAFGPGGELLAEAQHQFVDKPA